MPKATVDVVVGVPKHQVEVLVVDERGKPLKGVKVRIHRAITVPPFANLVDEKVSDEYGRAWFDGLWTWTYAIEAVHEERDLAGEPVIFTVKPGETYSFKITCRPPPHLYELRVNVLLAPLAELSAWLADNMPSLVEATVGAGAEFVDAWAEDGWVVVRFRITHSPGWLAVVLAILAVLVVLGIIGWEVKEIVERVPWWVLAIAGVGIAGLGVGYLIKSVRE